jgi:hypothetical protein
MAGKNSDHNFLKMEKNEKNGKKRKVLSIAWFGGKIDQKKY